LNSEYWLSLTIYWLFVWERLICGSYYQKPAHRLVLQKAVELQGKIVECPKVLGDIRGGYHISIQCCIGSVSLRCLRRLLQRCSS